MKKLVGLISDLNSLFLLLAYFGSYFLLDSVWLKNVFCGLIFFLLLTHFLINYFLDLKV